MTPFNHQNWGQCFPPPGPQFGPGPQCMMMNPPAFMNMNMPPVAIQFPEPCMMNCNMQGGMPCAPKAPNPCNANKCAETCDTKCAEKHAFPSNTQESCDTKSSLTQPDEKSGPSRPPCPTMSRCYPTSVSQMGMSRGFPAFSRCFPPRKMYQYTTSKTFKSCYAK